MVQIRRFKIGASHGKLPLSGMQESRTSRAHTVYTVVPVVRLRHPDPATVSAHRWRIVPCVALWLALLLPAASVAASPKTDYSDAVRACAAAPPAAQQECYNEAIIAWRNSGPADDVAFIFDASGRIVKIVQKDGTTLGEFGYDGDSPAPVTYTARNGPVRQITDDDRQWVTEQVAQINPEMSEAELDAKIAEISTQWQRPEGVLALTPSEPNLACITACDKFWMRGSLYCINLFPISHVWAARCALAMGAGDLLCRLACPPPPPPDEFEHTWCMVYPLQGWPAMGQHPENCGPDPYELIERGCGSLLAGTPYQGLAFPVNPAVINGGFRHRADCFVPTAGGAQLVDFSYIDYVVLCRPGFAQSAALQWIITPDDTLRHVCL